MAAAEMNVCIMCTYIYLNNTFSLPKQFNIHLTFSSVSIHMVKKMTHARSAYIKQSHSAARA